MEARPAGRRLPPHTTWPRGARVRERAPEREGRSAPMPTAGVMLDGTTEAGAALGGGGEGGAPQRPGTAGAATAGAARTAECAG